MDRIRWLDDYICGEGKMGGQEGKPWGFFWSGLYFVYIMVAALKSCRQWFKGKTLQFCVKWRSLKLLLKMQEKGIIFFCWTFLESYNLSLTSNISVKTQSISICWGCFGILRMHRFPEFVFRITFGGDFKVFPWKRCCLPPLYYGKEKPDNLV